MFFWEASERPDRKKLLYFMHLFNLFFFNDRPGALILQKEMLLIHHAFPNFN
jgi:hypothetical protein